MSIESSLDSINQSGKASAPVVALSKDLWAALSTAYPGLVDPVVAAAQDGRIMLVFNDSHGVLEFDVMPGGSIVPFYYDNVKHEVSELGHDFYLGSGKVEDVFPDKVKLFVQIAS